jgi:hypothetical protein
MGDLINLRRARKAKARQQDEAAAAQNRLRFGRSKAEQSLTTARQQYEDARLDGHLLPQHPPPDSPTRS